MDERRKERLTALGAETPAQALAELASHDEAADDLVQRLLAAPEENVRRFKKKLAALGRSQRFISWNETTAYARELETLLEDLRAGVSDPREGVELVAAFYEADRWVFESCDDSSGNVGDVYRHGAADLFVHYAAPFQDKDYLIDLVLRLNQEDNYGVRDALIHCAARYLPERHVRTMISRLKDPTGCRTEEYSGYYRSAFAQSLARQIGDAPLFEKTRLASCGEPTAVVCIDIARVYLECGDAETALSWLSRIPQEARHYECDQLLLDVHGRLGNKQGQADAAWRLFRAHRCSESLEELLSVIGEDRRGAVIADEVSSVLNGESLSLSNAAFLMDLGKIDEAEGYLLGHAGRLGGEFYGSLLPLAEGMERNGRALAATVIYRALLDSILERAKSKAYGHGVRYLQKLEALAAAVPDWRDLGDHDAYLHYLRQTHGRKYGFWSRYEDPDEVEE